jgi:hypothetical protein
MSVRSSVVATEALALLFSCPIWPERKHKGLYEFWRVNQEEVVLQMTSFLHWRKMTWALVLWSAYLATWMVLTRSGPVIVIVWWLAGVGVLQLIMHWGRIEPSRRHGPFDPRFRPRPNTARLPGTNDDLGRTPEQASTGAVREHKEAVQDWETEGGAIAEQPRANPTAQAA